MEFYTGVALFQTHDNLEHLAMMEPVCNAKIERDIIRAVHRKEKHKNQNSATGYAYVRADPDDDSLYIYQPLTKPPSSGRSRFFNGNKLDYPNAETPKTSKKYVKAMKKLNVRRCDPRRPGADIVTWIEDIPFAETRGYVQRVLENTVVYDRMNPRASAPRQLSHFLGKPRLG